jgi:hypothetical protein
MSADDVRLRKREKGDRKITREERRLERQDAEAKREQAALDHMRRNRALDDMVSDAQELGLYD